ncbi:MAG: hypothetical protein M3Q99_16890, partial [Acidobacteriota bacterium]|nr:hypothetical protein [Acidobacteriota bacterium]
YIIGLSLVFTGAFFIGFPLGRIVGRRQMRRQLETEHDIIESLTLVPKTRWRFGKTDILSAEIIEKNTEVGR